MELDVEEVLTTLLALTFWNIFQGFCSFACHGDGLLLKTEIERKKDLLKMVDFSGLLLPLCLAITPKSMQKKTCASYGGLVGEIFQILGTIPVLCKPLCRKVVKIQSTLTGQTGTTYRKDRGLRTASCQISFEFLFIKTLPLNIRQQILTQN